MPSRDELERASRELDKELPASRETAAARAGLETMLNAAAQLPVELPAAEVDRLVGRVLAPQRRLPLRIWGGGAAVAVLAIGTWLVIQRPVATLVDLKGAVAVNSAAAAEGDRIRRGAAVETGADGTVRLSLSDGDVFVGPNTRVAVGGRIELRSGVVHVEKSPRVIDAPGEHTSANAGEFVVAEPADSLDRVTAQLFHSSPEADMRTLLLSLSLPVVALGATTTPHTVNPQGDGPAPAMRPAQPAADLASMQAQIAALTAEQAELRRRVDALVRTQQQSAEVAAPLPQVTGRVFDSQGRPAVNVAVQMFVGDARGETAYSAYDGRFTLDAPADGEGSVFAHQDGRNALAAHVRPGAGVTLNLVEPMKISVNVLSGGEPATGAFRVYASPVGVPLELPELYVGRTFTGDHVELEHTPGDLLVHVQNDANPVMRGIARVRAEAGRPATVTIDLQVADASVKARVFDAVTHKSLRGYRADLLFGDDVFQQGYRPDDAELGFRNRLPGPAVLVITADGYRPLRTRFTFEAKKFTDLGQLLLQPL
jgi:hypothetical protein